MYITGIFVGFLFTYMVLTLICFYAVHQFPRRPIVDKPDWGVITDTKIEALDGRKLETWRITPLAESQGVVILAHGWGRNRDRMVNRARLFGRLNFTCVIHSARDHGNSTPKKMMNALRFAEDIEAVIKWVDEPVILYGHSAGAAGAIIAASRNQTAVRLLVLEACYHKTVPALLNLYQWINPFFGRFFGPMIIFWMKFFYREFKQIDPSRLARQLHMPVLIVHGEKDQRFPKKFAYRLYNAFRSRKTRLFIGKGAGHSDSSLSEGYEDAIKSFVGLWDKPNI